MPTCFVIQPFDSGKFDKRFEDVYKPAIEAADLMCVHFETENFRETLSSFSKAASQSSQFGRILDLKRNAH